MRIFLALDIGDKRVGMAYGDYMGITTKALKTVDISELLPELSILLKENQVLGLIVGLPKHKDGSNSLQTNKILTVVKDLKVKFPELEIHLEDEILTSKEATSRLEQRGIKITKENKHLIDAEAAAIILEQYFANNF
jgi:putative Holliday junction resolvase